MPMRVVWCTGISGAGRSSYIREAVSFAEAAGQSCRILDVADFLNAVPDHLKVGPNATSLLDGNEDVLNLHRAYALSELVRELEAATEDIVFVSTHASFMRRSRILSGLDMNFVREKLISRIDVFASVIHGCHDVWIELAKRPEWNGVLSLAEVAIWRDFETVLTKMLADFAGKPFYLLARSDPASALAQLATDPPTPSLYLSFPITAIQKEAPEVLDGARELAGQLRSAGFVVFDPLAIKDVPGTRAAAGDTADIPPEVEAAAAVYLNSQTISRDLQLIDQADMVVVYYPTSLVSPGVFTEMSHARDRRKPLYLIAFPGAPESVSPFLGLFHDRAYVDVGAMLADLEQTYLTKVEQTS
jgi:adenylate kinase